MDATLPPPTEELIESHLGLLQELTAVSSPTGDRAGLLRCCELLSTALAAQGMQVSLEDQEDGAGNLMPVLHATHPALAEGSCLLLVGHLDTVQAALPPRRSERRLWATGAIDMKGGLVALVGALAMLRAEGSKLPRDLRLLVLPDEETAGPICQRLMGRWTATARALWILEPGLRDARQEAGERATETLVIGRRGLFHWHLQAAGKAAHAGNDFWSGRSAVEAASEWTVAASAFSRPGGGPIVNPARLVAGEADFVDHLSHRAALLGTVRSSNVVPDRARIDGEARFSGLRDGEELLRQLQQLTGEISTRRGVALDFSHSPLVKPLVPSAASRQLAQRACALGYRRGLQLRLEEDRGGISFANFLDQPGAIPTLDGLGPTGGGMHTRQEFVWIDSFASRVTLLADLLAHEAD